MMMRPNSSSSSSVPNQHLNRVPLPYTGDRVGAPSPIPPATLPPNHSMPAMEEITVAGFSPYLPPSPFTMYHPTSRMVAGGENILPPPGKSHMRSNSDDVTFGFSSMMPQPLNSLPPLVPSKPLERSISGGREVSAFRGRTSESEYDIIRAYMEEEMESGRGTTRKKTNGGSGGEGIASPTCGHYRSVSLDSCFLGRPSSNSGEGEGAYSVEFGDCEFSPDEIERITADEKLAEIVVAEPKRVKRILANRLSAARSKERKMLYTAELEHKVHTLQRENAALSAHVTHLHGHSTGLQNQNSELRFRLQAMEQQAHLRNALSEKLTEEVQRLRLFIGVPSGSESNISKTSLNPEMFEQQLRISQLQHQHSNQNNSTMNANPASNGYFSQLSDDPQFRHI
ncbi:Basic-leucine zipper (bZIP) transcription factor family protein [Raphanus sativus]|uniref:BZIP transcription factor 30-like n=1 Tax=Raphanus sativus TaxID=3726 RepID=A0A6J0JKP4_RAPSA|nr:bZIP transcription factor 30-like [Raphanus sativus]KAJ4890891.1 Basic-leucine zipper (bZIP) transcription factor family protein [Raphanus sativus]